VTKRRIVIPVALLAAWAGYGLVMLVLADQEAMRCHGLGAAARACAAPFVRFYGPVSLLFLVATSVLAGQAWRRPVLSKASW